METTVTSLIKPIARRHIPYRLDNEEYIIQDNIILLTDKSGKQIFSVS